MPQRYRDLSVSFFSFHFPCLSGFLLICLINQRPSGPQKGCHTISTTFCGFPAKECGWWRLKPAKTTSVFFSLILALLRREGGGGKRKALIVSKKVLKRAKKSSWLWQYSEKLSNGLGGRRRPLLAFRRTEAPKAVEIEAVSRGSFKSSWSLMRLQRRRHRIEARRGLF